MDFLNSITYFLSGVLYWDMFPYIVGAIVFWSLTRIIRAMIY